MRILGIDYGDARTGLSISDPSGFLAGSPSVIHEWNYAKLVDKLVAFIQENKIEEIVLGHPKNMDGTVGPRAEKCETLAKELEEKGFQFSSANSINIGRLVPQIVYYFWAYLQAVRMGEIKNGEALNFTVPTGNFGDILAGWYAMQMGLPVGHFVCASNDNKVLYDFFRTGEYNKNRAFHVTVSPSMDILISSNLERLIYRIAGNSAEKNASLMQSLKE